MKTFVLEELSLLTQLRRAVKFVSQLIVEQSMGELAREMATLEPGDPRAAQIVNEMMRLRTD